MTLSTDAYTVELVNEEVDHFLGAPVGGRYERKFSLSEGVTSAHGVRVFASGGQQLASAMVLSGGGISGIHEHSAMLRGDALILAVGPHVVRLAVPSLDLVWSVRADDATCFGVHAIPDSLDLISHGELSIARITDRGVTVWSASGADIFTGALRVEHPVVRVTDFGGRGYAFDLQTGESQS